MQTKLKVKSVIALIVVVLASWQLSYTWRYYRLSPEKEKMLNQQYIKKLKDRAINLGLDLKGGMHLVLEVDTTGIPNEAKSGAVDRALEILRNRIDQFGVSEPVIAKQGVNSIVIELPGVVDRNRALEVIKSTAQLEFKLVEKDEVMTKFFETVDTLVYNKLKEEAKDTLEVLEHPLLSLIYNNRVAEYDTQTFNKYINMAKEIIPSDDKFYWSEPHEEYGVKYFEPLLIKKTACLKGDAIVDARANIGTNKNPIGSRVDLVMSPKARAEWARITGANINRRIAIILDNKVKSAPVVIERIAGGRSMIDMGMSPFKEAQDLALVIRAGALPAPVNIVHEAIIGPSLGKDSIQCGIKSAYIAAIVIVLFMLIYYAFCGLIANVALFLNIFLLLALLSGLRATLTLPGIAGIILVIGTGVDANIIIFERIREEIRVGKTIRTAIDAGYSNAMRAVLDANITTILAAIILYYFGVGPIRGFGTTLGIGTAINLFTAITVTKLVLDYLCIKGVKRLYI